MQSIFIHLIKLNQSTTNFIISNNNVSINAVKDALFWISAKWGLKFQWIGQSSSIVPITTVRVCKVW